MNPYFPVKYGFFIFEKLHGEVGKSENGSFQVVDGRGTQGDFPL